MSVPAADPVVAHVEAHVREAMASDSSGHDWWHIDRVRNTAARIAAMEDADPVVVELAALLHDLDDRKLGGDPAAGPVRAGAALAAAGCPPPVAIAVLAIVTRVSFKGAGVRDDMPSLEGRVVQDADRLDAIGAVGAARCFAYGGHAGRLLWNPDEPAVMHDNAEAYYAAQGSSRAHFDEKLLLLADRMHTDAGRQIAAGRHAFMREFLAQFDAEWAGER